MNKNFLLFLALSLFIWSCGKDSDVSPSTSDVDVKASLKEGVEPSSTQSQLFYNFTSVYCNVCYTMHQFVKDLEKTHADNLVEVSVSYSSAITPDKVTQTMKDIYKPQSFPNLVVRLGETIKGWNKGFIDGHFKSGTLPKVDIDLAFDTKVKTDSSNKTVVNFVPSVAGKPNFKGKITVFVTRSGIIASQRNNSGGTDTKYVHNNKLQKIMTSVKGNAFTIGENKVYTSKVFSYQLSNDSKVKEHAVVVVSDASGKYLNAWKIDLTKSDIHMNFKSNK